MKPTINRYFPELLLIATGLILFMPFTGALHLFDWDEINFAESAREMILTGDYLTVRIDFIPFQEKPLLFIWMQVLSMKLFGINEFAARFPNTVCGILTLILVFRTGERLYNRQFGYLWVLAYIGSILPFFYFKSGIIDPWFNLFIFFGLLQAILMIGEQEHRKRGIRAGISGLCIGLAVLTKGPVGFLLFILTVGAFWLVNRFRLRIGWQETVIFLLAAGIAGCSWFILQALNGNYHVILDFIIYQVRLLRTRDAGHGGFFFYHFLVLFLGVFPASVYALKGFGRNYYDSGMQKKFKIWMILLLLVVLAVFTIVRTKIVHYSSLAYFPITFLGSYTVYKILNNHLGNYRWLNLLYLMVGIVYGVLLTAAPFVMQHKDRLIASGLIDDDFAIGNLQARVVWTGWESLAGIVFVLGIGVFVFLLSISKTRAYQAVFLNGLVMNCLFILIFIPKVEGYTQHALISFCKDRQKEDCYVLTLGMKSYAHLFYTRKREGNGFRDVEQLIHGQIDKPAYFITRNNNYRKYLEQYPQLHLYKQKNGYVFLKRDIR